MRCNNKVKMGHHSASYSKVYGYIFSSGSPTIGKNQPAALKTRWFINAVDRKKAMIELPDDIFQFMKATFKSEAPKAEKHLRAYLRTGNDYLKSARLVRSILYMAGGDLDKLQQFIKAAKGDPLDILFWGEYENRTSENPGTVHDFSQPFAV